MWSTLLLLLPWCGLGLWAQVTAGKVYNFVNVDKAGQSMTAGGKDAVVLTGTDTKDKSQLWQAVAGTGNNAGQYALRNLSNGLYLRNPQATSNSWTLLETPDDNCFNFCVQVGSGYTMNSQNDTQSHNCMHYGAGQGRVVCWESAARASQWTLTEVPFTEEQLKQNWEEIDAIHQQAQNAQVYERALKNLFSDDACTILKNPAVGRGNADYDALPAVLQAMVDKVKAANWTEKNADAAKGDWDDAYAKKFRVQLYEPYSDPVEASRALKINQHTNLNNPTGLYANSRQVVYVMVEGEIKEGAEVYLGAYTGHGKPEDNFRAGTKLHTGFNVVPFYANESALFINYVVETFKGGKLTGKKLSDYKELKIHIEGGHINGYYNVVGDALYTPDKDADWNYYEQRANLQDITILGKYQALQFYLHDTADNDGKMCDGLKKYFTEKASVEKVMEVWDRIMYCERLTLGLLSEKDIQEANAKYPTLDDKSRGIYAYTGKDADGTDYSDAYRLHGLCFGVTYNFMFASGNYSGYNINTWNEIITNFAKDEHAQTVWGPAHEIGHQHQAAINMRGLTEVSNNVFSNVAVWYRGVNTSRVNGNEGRLTNVLRAFNQENSDFFTNNIWAQTHLYYKLWLYYHLTGHNNKFYPRLFEMLRKDPMMLASQQDGAKCLLHFYEKCCDAAQEDLTDFFRAYGFFSPMDNRFVDDYSSAYYTMTQAQIDASIKKIKAKGYPVNHNAILINDNMKDQVTYCHDGKTPRKIYDKSTVTDEFGGYPCFYLGKESKVTVPYTYELKGNALQLSGGKGGVGFLVYNEREELIAFADNSTFELSAKAKEALAKGKAKVYAAGGDNSLVPAAAKDEQALQKGLLKTLMEQVKGMLDFQDATGKKVGYYRAEAVKSLQEAYTQAEKVCNDGVSGSYSGAYDVLNTEYERVKADEQAKIAIVAGNAYVLENKNYPGYYLSVNGSNKLVGARQQGENEKWYLELRDGAYAVKSKAKGAYMAPITNNSEQMKVNGTTSPATFKLQDMDNGSFSLVCTVHNGKPVHMDAGHNVVGWYDATIKGSHWQLTAVEVDDLNQNKADLGLLVDQTAALLNQMAVVRSAVALQTTDAQAPGYLYCNAPYLGKNSDYSGADKGYNLLDNDPGTHLHTDYNTGNTSADGLEHYLRVDLGAGNSLKEFVLNYVTRNNDTNERPETMVVEGADAEAGNYTTITTLNNLPNQKAVTYEKKITSNVPYRYLRFRVTDTYRDAVGASQKKFFSMASFSIGYGFEKVVSIHAPYESGRTQVEAAVTQLTAARNILRKAEATAQELGAAYTALNEAYQSLQNIYNQVCEETVNAKKATLQQLMEATTALIAECGTVVEEGNGAKVTIKEACAAVSQEAMLAAYFGVKSAQTVKDIAKVEAPVDEAIADLQAKHDALKAGKTASPNYVALRQATAGKTVLVGGENPGFYTIATATAYNAALQAACLLVEKKNGNAQAYADAAATLQQATGALVMNLPETGKFYTLRSAHNGYAKDALVYANADNQMQFSAGVKNTESRAIWQFEAKDGGFIMKNLHTNGELGAFVSYNPTPLHPAGKLVSIGSLNGSGQVKLTVENTMMHAQESGSLVVAYDGNADSPSAWYIEEMKAPATVGCQVNVSENLYAGLYLGYNAVVPEGVTAYYAKAVGDTYVALSPVSGIVPANTGLIVKADVAGDYAFRYADETPAAVVSLFSGSTYTQYKQGEANHSYYLFGVKNGQVGLYKAWLEYNADGSKKQTAGTDAGGYFKVSANKIYLDNANATEASRLSFIFDDVTGIENAAAVAGQVIYNLQGRRIYEVQQSGLYIVNGQKVFIKK